MMLQPQQNQSATSFPHSLLHVDFHESVMFNNKLLEGTTTHKFLNSLMGDNPFKLQYIRNIFSKRDDVALTLVDHTADTPFRCLLIALFIKQLAKLLDIDYNIIRLYVTPLHREGYVMTGMADDCFRTTPERNAFLQEAVTKIVGRDFKFSCKRNHFRKQDIKLVTKDYTLHIRPLRPDGGLTKGWLTEKGDYPFMSAKELLDVHNHDIPCYNEHSRKFDKRGVFVEVELEPNSHQQFSLTSGNPTEKYDMSDIHNVISSEV